MATRETANRVYRLRIVLEGTQPEVWRRVEVPADLRLSQLNVVIQIFMGWGNSHQHDFEFAGKHYGATWSIDLGSGDRDEYGATVGDVLYRKGSKGVYTYDFGDDWRHLIVVEATGEADPDTFYPRVLDGHGGCPPEDCGGVYAFEHLRYLRDHPEELGRGDHSDADDQLMWVESLGPDELDLEELQRELHDVFGGPVLEDRDPLVEEHLPPARPVSLLPEEELADMAARTSPLRELLALTRWVSPDKRLTSTEVPRPADIRAAVEELDLWPRSSEEEAAERAERVKRLRAARDLPEFLDLWHGVVDLGLVEVTAGRARPSPGLLNLESSPAKLLDLWTELFESAVDGDTAGSGMFYDEPSGADLLHPVLRMLYEAPDDAEVDLGEQLRSMIGHTEAGAASSSEDSAALAGVFLPLLYQVLLPLGMTGGVRLVDNTPAEVRDGVLASDVWDVFGPNPGWDQQPPAIDCSVALTPLGRYGMRRMLLDAGVPAPLVGDLADAGTAEFLHALALIPPELHPGETAPWLAARTPAEAVREISEAAAEPTGIGSLRRALGAEVLSAAGEGVLPELRALLGSDRPTVAGLAASALLSSAEVQEEEFEALNAEHGPWLAIDMLSGPLELGEETLGSLIERAVDEDAGVAGRLLLDHMERLWQVEHPATVPVLEVLGRLHPDKTAGKSARRAAHKARSRK